MAERPTRASKYGDVISSPREPFVRHALPRRRPTRIAFRQHERAHEIGVLVDAADRPRDAVEIDVAGDAVAGRLVELNGNAHREARIALEPQAVPFVERAEV